MITLFTRKADPVLVDRLCEMTVGHAAAEEALRQCKAYRGNRRREPNKNNRAIKLATAAMTERLRMEVGE